MEFLATSSFPSGGVMQQLNVDSLWRQLNISHHWSSYETIPHR